MKQRIEGIPLFCLPVTGTAVDRVGRVISLFPAAIVLLLWDRQLSNR